MWGETNILNPGTAETSVSGSRFSRQVPNGRLLLAQESHPEDTQTATFEDFVVTQERWPAWAESLPTMDIWIETPAAGGFF
jgi:hypothetical protein